METVENNGVAFDLVRDISYDRGGQPRPTPLLFSADTANPYEIAQCRDLIANVTCNPGIVYDLFLNNPDANIGGEFSNLEEVLRAIAGEVGPGCDVSVELHNPYETDPSKLFDEIQMYEEILSLYRLVVKVPHTGAISPSQVEQLLSSDGRLDNRYHDGSPEDLLRGHALANKLHSLGHRVNFTLMFEPYQTPLALQVHPYFINAFVRNRLNATRRISGLLAAFEATEDLWFVKELRQFMVANHYLGKNDVSLDLLETLSLAKRMTAYRQSECSDGLDSVRASVRWLGASNLPNSRLIICSLEGDTMFPSVMSMMSDPEFIKLQNRVLVTTDPRYLARWASSPHVISYQQRFLAACKGTSE
ncbi:transaldolase family protein [Mycolicibacterium vanbaalenii]|uniref:transaldolase family protein n=1 Tax=Mycolicibacterium vanbaalenii TaxID=110539 RepID=UPI0013302EAE|nr:transaldolase family protein [Mycolicibacterium vanbaalenii]